MIWIRKDYDSPSHEVAEGRGQVWADGAWRWQAKTLCGRTVTGHSGGSVFRADCKVCRGVGEHLDS